MATLSNGEINHSSKQKTMLRMGVTLLEKKLGNTFKTIS
jgi:hypothetical protein